MMKKTFAAAAIAPLSLFPLPLSQPLVLKASRPRRVLRWIRKRRPL